MNSSNIDFTIPRRLNTAGFVIGALVGVGRFLRATWWSFAYILIKLPYLLVDWRFWLVLIGLLILGFVIAYVQYRHFMYYVDTDAGEFVVNQGVLSKSKTVIKFDNILQVKIKQNIIQQALDLYAVEIDSAGSKESEADLYALDEETAIQLKQYLSDRYLDTREDGGEDNTVEAAEQKSVEETVFRIPNGHILLVSLFTNYGQGLALFFAFVITTLGSFAEHLNVEGALDWYYESDFNLLSLLYYLGVAVGIIVLIPFFINLVRYFITYFNFGLRRNSKGNVFMHFGLFHIKDVILSRTKVQTLNRLQNPILRMLGIAVISLKQVVTDEVKVENSVVVMPGINRPSTDLLFDVLYDQDVYTGLSTLRPRIGLFISRMVKATVLFGLLCIPLYFFMSVSREILWGAGLMYILVGVYNYVYYLKYRLLVSDRFIIKRDGVWDMQDEIIPIGKIVTVEVSQTIFQKISDSGNLIVSTPAGLVSMSFYDKQQLVSLSNKLLYNIEKD